MVLKLLNSHFIYIASKLDNTLLTSLPAFIKSAARTLQGLEYECLAAIVSIQDNFNEYECSTIISDLLLLTVVVDPQPY